MAGSPHKTSTWAGCSIILCHQHKTHLFCVAQAVNEPITPGSHLTAPGHDRSFGGLPPHPHISRREHSYSHVLDSASANVAVARISREDAPTSTSNSPASATHAWARSSK